MKCAMLNNKNTRKYTETSNDKNRVLALVSCVLCFKCVFCGTGDRRQTGHSLEHAVHKQKDQMTTKNI